MLEIDLNPQFSEILKHHGINVSIDSEFINTDLPDNARFKARTVYQTVSNHISSRLDVMVVTNNGEKISESCGDFGETIEEAVAENFRNFSLGTLHPLLGALGCLDPVTYEQINFEDWEINNNNWKAYIGNLVPKTMGNSQTMPSPPEQFFATIEKYIHKQPIVNNMHWFRSYYCQYEGEITVSEFLMDNEPVKEATDIFKSLPIIPNTGFYSCRNFIILKKIEKEQ